MRGEATDIGQRKKAIEYLLDIGYHVVGIRPQDDENQYGQERIRRCLFGSCLMSYQAC